MIELIDRTIGDQIRVETVAGSKGWKIWVDRHQLENAMLNLAVNARDAMDGKGTLTISTGQRYLEHHEIRSEEHTSELQSLMRISYAVFCLTKKKLTTIQSN